MTQALWKLPGLSRLYQHNPAAASALMRGIRSIIAFGVGIALTAIGQGALFPSDISPIVAISVGAALQATDKYLRDVKAAEQPNG